MELTRGFDPTLPLDFNGSTNPLDLPDVTIDGSIGDHPPSRAASASPGLVPMLAKTSSGRMSPVRGRTMKEYDQQIAELKKENFSLKLRIYFLEERMEQKFGSTEDTFKTNIELKVAVQSLKQELADKQELLRKASQAMEALTSGQQSDLETMRQNLEAQHKKYTENLKSDLQQAIQEAERSREEAENANKHMNDLEIKLSDLERQVQQELFKSKKLEDAVQLKERDVADLQSELEEREQAFVSLKMALKEAEEEKQQALARAEQAEKAVQRKDRDVEQLSSALRDQSQIDGHSFLASRHLEKLRKQHTERINNLMDQVQDQQEKLHQLEAKIMELQEILTNRDSRIEELETEMRAKDKNLKEASSRADELAEAMEQEREYSRRRDLTIQGLVNEVHKKEKELSKVKEKLSKCESTLKAMRADLHEAEMNKHQEPQHQGEALDDAMQENTRLQLQLTEANAKTEEMIKSLGKKEGELAGFREQLDLANQALRRSEEALESLQQQLEQERGEAKGKLDIQAKQHQKLLEEYTRQLESKDSLMAQMTQQLRAKDKQLASLMDLLTDDSSKNQTELFKRLVNDLDKSASTLQVDLNKKQEDLEEMEQKLEDTRRALKDKGNELRQAAHKLQQHQDELEMLQHKNAESGEAIAHLTASLSKAQRALEESIDKHAGALQEKEKIIQQLQTALQQRDETIKEFSLQSPSIDRCEEYLHKHLLEKDRKIEELKADHVQAAVRHEQGLHLLRNRLEEKDNEIQALNSKHRKEMLNYDHEIKSLMAQLGQMELQVAELQAGTRLAEEQQQETLKRLQRMMREKDKTIEALVDSVEEKERLLRRSQQNLTEDAKAQIAEVESLQAENRRLRQQLDERSEYGGCESHDNYISKDSQYSSQHEKVIYTCNSPLHSDNKELVSLLRDQLNEMQRLGLLLQDHKIVLTDLTEKCSSDGVGPSSSASALRNELSASKLLQQHLYETLERSQQLHHSLLGYTVRQTDNTVSGENSINYSDSAASCASSSSTASHHADQSMNRSSKFSEKSLFEMQGAVSLATQTSPRRMQQVQKHVGGPAFSSFSLTEQHPNKTCYSAGDMVQESLDARSLSLTSLSSEQLAGMSAAVLRDLVSQLQEDLLEAAQRNAVLTSHFKALYGKDESCQGMVDADKNRNHEAVFTKPSPSNFQSQVESLKNELNLKDKETACLRQHLGLAQSRSGSAVDAIFPTQVSDLRAEIFSLRGHVKEMNKINELLRQQMCHCNGSHNATQVFSPELLTSMSHEIDCLYRQVHSLISLADREAPQHGPDSASNGEDTSSFHSLPVSPVLSHTTSSEACLHEVLPNQTLSAEGGCRCCDSFEKDGGRGRTRCANGAAENTFPETEESPSLLGPRLGKSKKGKTRIPVSQLPNLNLIVKESEQGASMATMTRKLQEAQERVKYLENRLAATESTVRLTSQRLRLCQSQVHSGNGAKGLPLTRSQSEICLLLDPFGIQSPPFSEKLTPTLVNRDSQNETGGHAISLNDSDGGMTIQEAMVQRIHNQQSEESDGRHAGMEDDAALQQEVRSNASNDAADGGCSSDSPHQNLGSEAESDSIDCGEHFTDVLEAEKDNNFKAKPLAVKGDFTHLSQQNASTLIYPRQLVQSDQTDLTLSSICAGERDYSMLAGELTYSSFSENILQLGPSHRAQDSAIGVSHLKVAKGNEAAKSSRVAKSLATACHLQLNGHVGDESRNESQLPVNLDASSLQAKVHFLTEMNTSLRDELKVYDRLCQSLGIQVSFTSSCVDPPTAGEANTDIELLKQHLVEIRRLRGILEQLDSDAYEDMQSTLLCKIQRVQELEAQLQKLREELLQKDNTIVQNSKTITEHENVFIKFRTTITQQESVIKETIVEMKKYEAEEKRLKEKIAVLEESSTRKDKEHEVTLTARNAQIGEVQRALKEAEKRIHLMQDQVAAGQQQLQAATTQLIIAKQHNQRFESQLKDSQNKCQEMEGQLKETQHKCQDMEGQLLESQRTHEELEQELKKVRDKAHAWELAVQDLQQQKVHLEEALGGLQRGREELEKQVMQATSAKKSEANKQRKRAEHLEECMKEHQQTLVQCEQKLKEAQESLHLSQAREQEAQATLQKCKAQEEETQATLKDMHQQISRLEAELREAEERASACQKVALHADSLVHSLENRVRDLEARVVESQEQARSSKEGTRDLQAVVEEQKGAVEKLKKELEQREAKLRKRDVQLKRLVPEYERIRAALSEVTEVNQTLRCEVRLYQDMQCQADDSSSQKELMRDLLQELTRTRKLVENIISRHRERGNMSPASTNGDAADGKPSPDVPHRTSSHSFEAQHGPISSSHTPPDKDSSASQRLKGFSTDSLFEDQNIDSPYQLKTVLTEESTAVSLGALSELDRFPGLGFSPKAFTEQKSPTALCPSTKGSPKSDIALLSNLNQKNLRMDSIMTGARGDIVLPLTPTKTLKYWQGSSLPSAVTGIPQVEVDSDLRQLFAVGALEGYEKLKCENRELLGLLSAMQARVNHRLKTFSSVTMSEIIKSVEYSTLRELHLSTENMRLCAEEEARLLTKFWITQLPPVNSAGEFYDPKLTEENENLKIELQRQKHRHDMLIHTVNEHQERLHATNTMRKKWEATLYKQLSRTADTLEEAEGNFSTAGLVPQKRSSRKSQPKGGTKDKK